MKFFIGTSDISSQIGSMVKGFRSLGHDTLSASAQVKIFQQSTLDYDFGEMQHRYFKWLLLPSLRRKMHAKYGHPRERILRKAIKECDVFVFVTMSFRRDLSDLKMIKEAGKKIVFIFTGTDVRWLYSMQQDFVKHGIPPVPYDDYNTDEHSLRQRLSTMRMAEKYANIIISMPNQSQLALRSYYPYRQFVDLEKFDHRPEQRKRPMIIHAASNQAGKGSKVVIAILEKLKAENLEFDFKILSGLPFHEITAEYANCDMLIGQMYAPSGGFQERELLACGKVVMTSILHQYPDHQLVDTPIIDVDPTNLEAKLRQWIPDLEGRQKLADQALPYAEKHHSPHAFCQNLVDILSGKVGEAPINPEFFRTNFVSQNDEETKVYNEYTELVSDCDWYQDVEKGERDGLVF
jgi:hypothetical protein